MTINKLREISFWKIMFLFIAILPVLVIVFINSDFYIKKSFNHIFSFRQSGDCEAFDGYVIDDSRNWFNECKNDFSIVTNYKILSMSHYLFSDRAFLQVKVEIGGRNYGAYYYEMTRVGLLWGLSRLDL